MPTNSDYAAAYAEEVSLLSSVPSENLIQEPPSPADKDHPPQYPYNQMWNSECGHSIQLDDTPGRERVRIQHGKSENFIEMHPNGTQVIKVFGESFDITIGKKNIVVEGVCNIVVKGDCNMQVDGNFKHEVNGDYTLAVKGNLNIRAVKDARIYSDNDMTIAASPLFGGRLNLSATTSFNINSDLHVAGLITCNSLTATTRVSGNYGVFAGPAGFNSDKGGLSLGLPTPLTPMSTPGCIHIIGSMVALGSVTAPTANFFKTNVLLAKHGITSAIINSDIINDTIFDFHRHPAPKGITGTPFIPTISI